VWTGSIWLRIGTCGWFFVKTVMNLRVPFNFGNFLNTCTIGGFSRSAQLHEVSYLFFEEENIFGKIS
jgi:hypothetical protein